MIDVRSATVPQAVLHRKAKFVRNIRVWTNLRVQLDWSFLTTTWKYWEWSLSFLWQESAISQLAETDIGSFEAGEILVDLFGNIMIGISRLTYFYMLDPHCLGHGHFEEMREHLWAWHEKETYRAQSQWFQKNKIQCETGPTRNASFCNAVLGPWRQCHLHWPLRIVRPGQQEKCLGIAFPLPASLSALGISPMWKDPLKLYAECLTSTEPDTFIAQPLFLSAKRHDQMLRSVSQLSGCLFSFRHLREKCLNFLKFWFVAALCFFCAEY